MTQRTSDTDAVAIALEGEIVRGERNLFADTALPGFEGARAALETFYYAFNTLSFDLLRQIWADDPLTQLDTPIAGLIRGGASIAAAYDRMRSSPVKMKTVLDDIVAYFTPGLAVFTERERADYTSGNKALTELSGRSICIFRFIAKKGGWRLIYHQVSVDDRGKGLMKEP